MGRLQRVCSGNAGPRPRAAASRGRGERRVREPAEVGHPGGQGVAPADHHVHRRSAYADWRRWPGRQNYRQSSVICLRRVYLEDKKSISSNFKGIISISKSLIIAFSFFRNEFIVVRKAYLD